MTTKFFSMGAVALLMGLVVGCQDSAVDSAQSSDPFAAYVVDESAMTDFSEIPTVEEALFRLDPNDSTDNDDDGGRDSIDRDHHMRDSIERAHRDSIDRANHNHDSTRGPGDRGPGRGRGRGQGQGHAWGRLEIRSYGRILGRLDLTAEQQTAIETCFTDYRSCAQTGAESYRTARGEMNETLKTALAALRAEVEAGTKTPEEARTAAAALIATYRTDVATLNATFKASVQACQDALDTCIEGNLTADQLVIWNRLHG